MAVGKSTACRALVGRLPGCVVIDTDILSTEMVATTQPEPDYERFHDVLLQLALEIGASGLSVLYNGPVLPRQVESSPLSAQFDIRWLALVADSETRFRRARTRGSDAAFYDRHRAIHDALDSELRLIAREHRQMQLLDTAAMSPHDVVRATEDWAASALANESEGGHETTDTVDRTR